MAVNREKRSTGDRKEGRRMVGGDGRGVGETMRKRRKEFLGEKIVSENIGVLVPYTFGVCL